MRGFEKSSLVGCRIVSIVAHLDVRLVKNEADMPVGHQNAGTWRVKGVMTELAGRPTILHRQIMLSRHNNKAPISAQVLAFPFLPEILSLSSLLWDSPAC